MDFESGWFLESIFRFPVGKKHVQWFSGRLFTIEPKYAYIKISLRLLSTWLSLTNHFVQTRGLTIQWSQTTRLYKIQVTVIHSLAILVSVTLECRVKGVICKTRTEHWRTVQIRRPQNTASDQGLHCLLKLQAVKGLNETALNSRSGPFPQPTRRDNLPTSAVSALTFLNFTLWGAATLSGLFCLPLKNNLFWKKRICSH